MNEGDDRISDSEALTSSGWEGFVYLSGSSNAYGLPSESDDRSSTRETSVEAILPLSSKRSGDRIRLVSLNCGDANNRLMGMGLIPGAVLKIVSCTPTGSVIVALHDQRLGLSADMSYKILVIDAEQSLDTNSTTSVVRMATMQTTSETATVKLRDVAIGTILRVVGYEAAARDYKRKLLAMGLTPGTELRVTRHAPLGDPTEISVRGFQLSLRKAESDALIVVPVPGS